MNRLLAALLLLAGAPALAQIDPGLVGMWQLQWQGGTILWQVRADGNYRLIGVGVRPLEHWGRLQASGNRWSSEWEKGVDGGTYELRNNVWSVTGVHGTGTWSRIWPRARGTASCPQIDAAAVENLFGGAAWSREVSKRCDIRVDRTGGTDQLTISIEGSLNDMTDGLRLHRAACSAGTNKDPGVQCIADLGDVAFFFNDNLHVYRQATRIALEIRSYPKNAAINQADEIALSKIALAQLPR